MSHLIVKKVDGKYKAFNKLTQKTEGKPMKDKEEAEEKTEKRDEVEDKELESGKGGGKTPMHLKLKEGALHKDLKVKEGTKIPESKLAIKSTDSPLEKKRKQFAINAKKWHHNGA